MSAVQAKEPTLSVRGITKSFGGALALSGVDLDLFPGEVHALVGENGAGKSTLIKLVTGVYQLDEGQVLHNGAEAHFPSPREAQLAGIQTIYQEVHLAPQLSIARNVFLGREQHTRFGGLDLRRMNREAAQLLDRYGIAADVKVYPDAGHSFANKLPGQPLLRIPGFGYNDVATEDAYSRVFAFFNEHLASPLA